MGYSKGSSEEQSQQTYSQLPRRAKQASTVNIESLSMSVIQLSRDKAAMSVGHEFSCIFKWIENEQSLSRYIIDVGLLITVSINVASWSHHSTLWLYHFAMFVVFPSCPPNIF